jgi:hypothetical protein
MAELRIDECDHIRIHQGRAKRKTAPKVFLVLTVERPMRDGFAKKFFDAGATIQSAADFLEMNWHSFTRGISPFFSPLLFAIHPIDSMNDEVEGFG